MILKIDRQKKKLREKIKEKTAGLSEAYCIEADEKICYAAVNLPEYQKAETVFCYVGTDREINTIPILREVLASGKRLCIPKCVSKGIMEAYQIKSLDDLEVGAYEILEPKKECMKINPEEIDLAFIPCMTCSIDGIRLGYGGGYYDRYLAQPQAKFVKAVLCRAELVEENIPAGQFDQKIDVIITEKHQLGT